MYERHKNTHHTFHPVETAALRGTLLGCDDRVGTAPMERKTVTEVKQAASTQSTLQIKVMIDRT